MPRSSVLPTAASDLPIPLDRLIGREADLERAERHFQTGFERLLTITGPGGGGKTRFALALAERLSSGFRDGVVVIDLSTQRESVQIPAEVARVLNARGSGFAEGNSLDGLLKAKDCLLVLDNLEQIAGAGAPITDLLERFPGLHLLVTSRTTLGIRGERRFPLQPLPCVDRDGRVGPAVALFLERARAVNPDLELTEGNEAVFVKLCERLDGLPLALELAAARSNLYNPEGLLALLERGGDLSVSGRTERHSSLESLLTWSCDLLEAYERTLLRRLGVFEGAFDAEAASAVAGEFGVNTLEALSQLSERSLLVTLPGETPRFRLLETVRAYVLKKLEVMGETAQTRDQHATYYGSRAAIIHDSIHEPGFEWGRTSMVWAAAQFETALDWSLESVAPTQLLAATDLMRTLCMYTRSVNGSHRCFRQLEQLIQRLPSAWVRERIDLSIIQLYTSYFKDVPSSLLKIEALIVESQSLADPLTLAQLYCLSAVIHIRLGVLPEFILQRQYRALESLKDFVGNNEKIQRASIYDVLSHHYNLAGDFERSLTCSESALNIARECKIHHAICNCLENTALTRFIVQPDHTCISMLEEAINLSTANGYEKRTSVAQQLVAEIHLVFGHVEPAWVYSQSAVQPGVFSSGPGWERRTQTLHAQILVERDALQDGWSQAAQVLRASLSEKRWVYSSLTALTLADCLDRVADQERSARWLRFSAHCASLSDSTLSLATDLHLKRTRSEQRERLERELIKKNLNLTAQGASAEQVLEWLEQDTLSLATTVFVHASPQNADLTEVVTRTTKAESVLRLSPRETEILSLLARGQTNKHIAQHLALSPSTVETHLKRLFIKLEVRTRAQAVSRATELGWL